VLALIDDIERTVGVAVGDAPFNEAGPLAH
jgi:hypothetical protein